MKMQTKGLRNLGLAIFTFGVLLGLILNGLTVWGDIEANLFDVSIGADQSLKSLRCPLVISSSETGAVTASFTNTADRELTLIILARISESRLTVMREYRTLLPLSPDETRTLQWEVTERGCRLRIVSSWSGFMPYETLRYLLNPPPAVFWCSISET
jgi:hypothetical protein